jgi:DNA-binding transcriptional MocR family regulator
MPLWIEFDSGIDTTELAALAMNKHRIAVAPGCIFSANRKKFRNCLRISCGHPWSPQIENALETLGKLAK